MTRGQVPRLPHVHLPPLPRGRRACAACTMQMYATHVRVPMRRMRAAHVSAGGLEPVGVVEGTGSSQPPRQLDNLRDSVVPSS